MKTPDRRALVFTALLPLLSFGAETPPPDVSALAWMEGRWTGRQDGVEMEEQWTSPAGGALLGLHKDVKGGRLVLFEFLRIAATSDGIVYFASPRSAPPTPFRLLELADRRVVFENKEHDFPQRILYWREGDVLHARVEGTRGGRPVGEEWSWRKS